MYILKCIHLKIPGVNSSLTCEIVMRPGEFIGGLLANGNLFLWHKSSDQLIHIPGLSQFATKATTGNGIIRLNVEWCV